MAKKIKSTTRPIADGHAAGPSEVRISSPASTGGAGTLFEQHVGAYWLGQLLVRSIPPILHDCVVLEVHFQTENLSWRTDDFLIVGQNGSGSLRKLAGQVKRAFTVSATDEECRKTVRDFWTDFRNPQQFSRDKDRFALVTLRGTNTLLEHFASLLDCACSAPDGAEFERRLSTPGFISSKAIRHCDEIRAIVGEMEGRNISTDEIWPLLSVLHVLSLDLNTPTRQTEVAIRTLLAYTTNEQDAAGAAETSWNSLLRDVGEGMPGARGFRRDDLPEALRRRHLPVGRSEQRVLKALSEHSALILQGIRSTIGREVHLGRGRLVQQVIEQLESSRVVIVSGPAGGGKSGIAKEVVRILAADHFAFAFRAEVFASAHLDETLQRIQIPSGAQVFAAILAGQERKVLLVESVERLLEASTRDAFSDLLTLVANDKSWRLILTCRDYSADLIRTAFMEAARIGHSIVAVPPLDDEELREVEAAYPTLARPLANAELRRLLRNPYLLDKALLIAWSSDRPLPQSEREFRALLWQQVVRVNHRVGGGMPRKREEAFVQIALCRARALTLYASCANLDPEVVDALRHDSLVVSPQENGVLVAPAHDVLEDWAILHWIDELNATHDGSVQGLSVVIGAHPAIRRTYRKWVSELVERDPDTADRLFQAVLHEAELPAQFQDDTLVSLLRSSTSASFLERHSAELFANDKQLLRRVIHLLRVACVTTPAWLEISAADAFLFSVPDGPAWACVLRLVQTHLQSFTLDDRFLLLQFIEDWAGGVSQQTPYPEGAEPVTAIAHWLLAGFNDYRSDEPRKRTLKIIAKIPKAGRGLFAALLQGRHDPEERNRTAATFREIILETVEGMPAGRDMPDAVVESAKDHLLCAEADLEEESEYERFGDLEPLFGIKKERSHDYFPASAYRGAFLPLLRHHPGKGLNLMIDVFNHSAAWYAHPRIESEYVEPPFEMTLAFADGTSQTQWCNSRLWNWYRGTSVGPYALQSLLMALERWLLEYGEARPRELDGVLLQILRRSDSAALTAVVASVATAFPHASGETLLVLLRCPGCIRLDRQRLSAEGHTTSKLSLPELDSRNRVYQHERKEADARFHRRQDLEAAISNLQLGPFAQRVHEILDWHRAQMPSVKEQGDDDRVWRLALHRMDLRQYSIGEEIVEGPAPSEGLASSNERRRYIRMDPKDPEPDVKEMMDQAASKYHAVEAGVGLLVWGVNIFRREGIATYDPAQWRECLQQARNAGYPPADLEEYQLGRGGPGFVAAICARDHWDEMSSDEQEWCVNVICSEIERDADNWSRHARVQLGGMEGDRPCAWALPLLLGKPLPEPSSSRVRQMLIVALTHAIDEVRSYAAWGVGMNLWGIDRELTLRCANMLATEATIVLQTFGEERGRRYQDRREIDDIEREAAHLVRERFFQPEAISAEAYRTLDSTRWFGAEADQRILTILGQAPTEATAIEGFQRLATTLAAWWDADGDRRRRHQENRERNHKTEAALTKLLEHFLLRTSFDSAATIVQPIVDAIDRHPDKVCWLLIGLIGVEDGQSDMTHFWSLWDLFSDRVRRATWLEGIDGRHARGAEMVSAIFLLGTSWKENVRHWRRLEGYEGKVDRLFEELPASTNVFEAYLGFLYHVGEHSLPRAFIRIARRLRTVNPGQMIRKKNTVFLLEVLLRRYVYGRPLELKRQGDLREAVLFLLDVLIESGSSAAFRMRDDFVTPISIT
jgi:hypothetical protein